MACIIVVAWIKLEGRVGYFIVLDSYRCAHHFSDTQHLKVMAKRALTLTSWSFHPDSPIQEEVNL